MAEITRATINDVPALSQTELKRLYRLLASFTEMVRQDQPLSAQVVSLVRSWVGYFQD